MAAGTNDEKWHLDASITAPKFAENWFMRAQDLVDSYKPDLLYFDDSELPHGIYGLSIAAHYYNTSVRDKGKLDVVLTTNDTPARREPAPSSSTSNAASPTKSSPQPWQTDTCIGNWHYDPASSRATATKLPPTSSSRSSTSSARTATSCSISPSPATAPSTPTSRAFLEAIATWIPKHGEGHLRHPPILRLRRRATRRQPRSASFNERNQRPYTSQDIRFTRKGETLYAFAGWPTNGKLLIKTLARGAAALPRPIQRVELIGAGQLAFAQDATGLTVNLPDKAPNPYAYGFIIRT